MKRNRSLQTGWLKPEPPSAISRLICGRSPGMLCTSFSCAQWLSPWRDSGMDPLMGIKICSKKWPSLEMRPSTHVVGSAGLTHSPLKVDHSYQNPTDPKVIEQLSMPEKVPSVAASSPSPWEFCWWQNLFGWHKVNLSIVHFIKAIDVLSVKQADCQAHTLVFGSRL